MELVVLALIFLGRLATLLLFLMLLIFTAKVFKETMSE